MKWEYLITVEKDEPGLSEVWSIDIAWINDGQFSWKTSGGDQDPNEPIDTGSAKFILDYLIENASWEYEDDLYESIRNLAEKNSKFAPFLDALPHD